MSEVKLVAEFGNILRTLRMSAGLSQSQLAREVYLSNSQISRLERGNRRPDLQLVCRKFVPALRLKEADSRAKSLIMAAQRAQYPSI
jgi:transcriptional regulator with XRE-family HTH domain